MKLFQRNTKVCLQASSRGHESFVADWMVHLSVRFLARSFVRLLAFLFLFLLACSLARKASFARLLCLFARLFSPDSHSRVSGTAAS